MITKRNRTQEEINSDDLSLMYEIEQLRKDFHDRCDEHKCQMCIGK